MSSVLSRARDSRAGARIRARRPAKERVDPWRPLGVVVEDERGLDGEVASTLTVFLAGSECPFTCVFCDLWRHTLDRPTPRGALPKQLDLALAELDGRQRIDVIKLYNASNFFDSRAVPPADWDALAERLEPFPRVVVECHPRLVDDRCRRFADLLAGELEIAMGLETVHAGALARLNKQMTLGDFERAVARLGASGIATRAFVLVGPPFVPAAAAVEWAVRSVDWALRRGVGVVSLIPTRPSAGEMQRLQAAGDFASPTLADLERALGRALQRAPARRGGVVLADLWDLEALASCPACRAARIGRVRRMNLEQRIGAPVECDRCAPDNGAT